MPPRSDHPLATVFTRFAERETAGTSPLYAALSHAVAADRALLDLAARRRLGQPAPNMLFAAVQFLLQTRHDDDPLADFYASIVQKAEPPEAAATHFARFCRVHDVAITNLLRTRSVNTNEVRRCALLLPGFAAIADNEPLHIVEIGTSAGLNLFWDRYCYDYGAGLQGDPSSPLVLNCALRGPHRPPLAGPLPSIASRIGIDRVAIDLDDADDRAWLRALIWPEHTDRMTHLDKALAIARGANATRLHGDAFDLLPRIIQDLPAGGTACVVHSMVIYQFDESARIRFDHLLDEIGHARPLHRLGFEWQPDTPPLLWTTHHDGRPARQRNLAHGEAHGRWLEWLEK